MSSLRCEQIRTLRIDAGREAQRSPCSPARGSRIQFHGSVRRDPRSRRIACIHRGVAIMSSDGRHGPRRSCDPWEHLMPMPSMVVRSGNVVGRRSDAVSRAGLGRYQFPVSNLVGVNRWKERSESTEFWCNHLNLHVRTRRFARFWIRCLDDPSKPKSARHAIAILTPSLTFDTGPGSISNP